MRNADKNRDPERARKRAKSDLRCAARKIGLSETIDALATLLADDGEYTRLGALAAISEAATRMAGGEL